MSDTTGPSPIATAVSFGKAPNTMALSNVWNHMSSTWTAIGLVLGALVPIFSQNAPTTPEGWAIAVAMIGAAIVKALGR